MATSIKAIKLREIHPAGAIWADAVLHTACEGSSSSSPCKQTQLAPVSTTVEFTEPQNIIPFTAWENDTLWDFMLMLITVTPLPFKWIDFISGLVVGFSPVCTYSPVFLQNVVKSANPWKPLSKWHIPFPLWGETQSWLTQQCPFSHR